MKKSSIVLLHIGYWFLYLLLLSTFMMALPHVYEGHSLSRLGRILFFSPISVRFVLPSIISFYAFYLFLFPLFLQRKKITLLIISSLLIAFAIALLTLFVAHLLFNEVNTTQFRWADIFAMLLFLAILSIVHGAIGLVIKGFISWYADIQLKEALNKKNYEMELALVKSQLNPHFLFNSINNIDVLIEKDAAKASLYLNKLSDMMRFMLYETKLEKVTLAKELDYVEKYIALQKIRTSNPNYISYSVEGSVGNICIASMVFIPFIENAFKYAENKKEEKAVVVNILIKENSIYFTCKNKYLEKDNDTLHGGLGNELIQKRLALLYPNKHVLQITNINNTYCVALTLSIHDN
jgi:two-component system, LytTR family, sensor kinase